VSFVPLEAFRFVAGFLILPLLFLNMLQWKSLESLMGGQDGFTVNADEVLNFNSLVFQWL